MYKCERIWNTREQNGDSIAYITKREVEMFRSYRKIFIQLFFHILSSPRLYTVSSTRSFVKLPERSFVEAEDDEKHTEKNSSPLRSDTELSKQRGEIFLDAIPRKIGAIRRNDTRFHLT